MLAFVPRERLQIDAENAETGSKLADLSVFFPRNPSALETPRNFSVIFRFRGFCVFSFPATIRNLTNRILRLFVFLLGGNSEKRILRLFVVLTHAGLHPRHAKSNSLDNLILASTMTIAARVATVTAYSLPTSLIPPVPIFPPPLFPITAPSLAISSPSQFLSLFLFVPQFCVHALSLSLFLSFRLFQSLHLSVCLSFCLSVCLPVCPSIRLSVCLSACLPVCLSARRSFSLSVLSLSFFFSVCQFCSVLFCSVLSV